MRFKEIKEASILSRPGAYEYGHKVNISGSKSGKALLSLIQQKIPEFQPTETLTWVEKVNGPNIQVGKSSAASMSFKRESGQGFTLVGSESTIESGLTHAAGAKGSTAENKGDLAEPLLSAAVVAKLIRRGSDSVEDITMDDLKNTLNQAIAAGEKTYKVNDQNSKIADTIEFKVAIRGPAMQFLRSDAFWPKMANTAQAALHYANSGQIDRYADYFYKNGKADLIKVDSDGLSDQKGRKTDIDAYVSDDKGNMRPLKGLAISLKAGSDTIGQVGGGSLKNDGVIVAANKLFGPLGVTIDKPAEKITSKTDFWVSTYEQAYKQLRDILKGQDAKSEAGVVQKIGEFVADQGSSGNPNVRLISLKSTGKSSVHSFKNLATRLRANDIDLDCKLVVGKSKVDGSPRPSLFIFDKNSGTMALKVRYSVANEGTKKEKIWNPVEMGPLIQQLTTMKYKDKTDTVSDPYIQQLKTMFNNKKNLTSAEQRKVTDIINKLNSNNLKKVADENIPFVSDAAKQKLQGGKVAKPQQPSANDPNASV